MSSVVVRAVTVVIGNISQRQDSSRDTVTSDRSDRQTDRPSSTRVHVQESAVTRDGSWLFTFQFLQTFIRYSLYAGCSDTDGSLSVSLF